MSKFYLGIDQSKRSTGCVLLNEEGGFVDCLLIFEPKIDNEELIIHQWSCLDSWLEEMLKSRGRIAGALIEGLSFGSVGSGKDFLAGLQWYFRAQFRDDYGIFLGTVPVTMWRSKVLTKEEQREAKAQGKNGLKEAVFAKLPLNIQGRFKEVAKKYGKKDSIYDLSDAYFISLHRFNLSTSK